MATPRTTPSVGVALVLAAALVLGGCGDSGSDTKQGAATTAPAPPSTTPAEGNAPRVELVEPGSEPRQALRYSVKAGDHFTATLTQQMGMTMTIEGETREMALPVTEMDMDVQATDVTADRIATRIEFTGARASGGDPGAAQQAQQALDSMIGVTGNAVMTPRGEVTESKFDLTGADPMLAQYAEQFNSQMQSLATPMPAEPVGVGARWKVLTSAKLNGIAFTIEQQVTLAQLDGSRFKLEISLEQRVIPGPINVMGVTGAAESGRTTGSGTVDGTLDSLVAAVRTTAEGDMAMTFKEAGEDKRLTQHITMTMSIKPT